MKNSHLRYVVIIMCLVGVSTACSAELDEPSRAFVFRFDDYPTSDLSVQKSVIALFRDKGIPLTVGAISARLRDYSEAMEFLAGAIGPKCEVALHGWDHGSILQGVAPSEMSEFVGLPADDQYARIMQGVSVFKEHLGVAPVTFVPPFNTYDESTVEALHRAEIRFLSADVGRREVDHGDLVCVPQTCLLRDIIGTGEPPSGLYIVLFHDYDFVETGNRGAYVSLEGLDSFLTRLAASPDTVFFNIASVVESGHYDFSQERLNAGQAVVSYPGTRLFGFPAHWVRQIPTTYENPDAYSLLLRRAGFVGTGLDLLAGLGVLGVFVATYMLSGLERFNILGNVRARRILSALLLAGLLGLASIGRFLPGSAGFGYKDRVATAVLVAVSLAWITRSEQVIHAHKDTG